VSSLPKYPFDSERYVGTISEIGPTTAKINLPKAAEPAGHWIHGYRMGGGEVGEFVFIECGDRAVFGRIIYVKLPERDRLSVEPQLGKTQESHPLGTVQLLTTLVLKSGKMLGGIPTFPKVGSRVYSAHPLLIKWVAEATQKSEDILDPIVLEFGIVPSAEDTQVNLTPERIFGRHAAVLGATGGGKSWTLSRLMEEAAKYNSKIILLDATGEFHTLTGDSVKHVQIGDGVLVPEGTERLSIPSNDFTEQDMFAMFRPSGGVQGPKLRAAMRTLKLVKALGVNGIVQEGTICKTGLLKARFNEAYTQHVRVIESPLADFDCTKLSIQIQYECVFPAADYGRDQTRFGDSSAQDINHCIGLLTRIDDMLQSPEFACVFAPGGLPSFMATLNGFLSSDKKILRVSLKYLPSSHNAREIIANIIGRYLLAAAKEGAFQDKPVVVMLDEAHQFLNKSLGDENNKYPLESFELIAKEGRKFSLNICLATQRPRDIPEGVLSQMGTLIVHRLINEKDREVVEKASGDIDKSAAAFLPTLAPGEAVIVGVDFPIPLTVQVSKPQARPDSKGPDYQGKWKIQAQAAATAAPGPGATNVQS
jgi:Helicase HerA, central domain/Helicase HerA-like C-terminal